MDQELLVFNPKLVNERYCKIFMVFELKDLDTNS